MKKIYSVIFLLLLGQYISAQTLSLYCETGSESGNLQHVYVYGENLTNQDQPIGAMTLLLAHQQQQQWQPASSWSLTDVKWDGVFSKEEDVAQATGYGSGFSHLFRCGQAAGPDDEPMILPANTKMLLARIAFTQSLLGEQVYLVGPQEDQMVAIADEDGDAINFQVTGQPVVAGLPVELIEFKASQIGERLAEIRWTSQLETQTEAYLVEKSLDGEAFEVLSETPATGPGRYVIRDEAPFLPKTHYRLRWRDTDGETGLTETVQVLFSESDVSFMIFPNPSQGEFELRYGEKLNTFQSFSLVNSVGKTVIKRNSLPDDFSMKLDMRGYPSGVYQVYGVSVDGAIITTSLIIQ